MFLGIQQARRDLEARGALAEIQNSWNDPAPPIPSNEEDPAHLWVKGKGGLDQQHVSAGPGNTWVVLELAGIVVRPTWGRVLLMLGM